MASSSGHGVRLGNLRAAERVVCALAVALTVVVSGFPGRLSEVQGRTRPNVGSGFSRTQEQSPWFGTWQQIPPSRKWFNPWPYQKVTLRIEPSDDGLVRVVYDLVKRRGGIQHMEWSGRFDGKDYPMQGVDYVLTNAYRKLSDRSYEIVVRVDGRDAAVATAVVSSDGRTLNVDTKEQDTKGRTVTTTARYQRR